MSKPTFFVTFPQRIPLLRNRYVLIPAMTYDEARKIAFRDLGTGFGFIYEGKDELRRQEDLYRIRPIDLDRAQAIIKAESDA